MDNLAALNTCEYLYLVGHEKASGTTSLRLVIHEARAEKPPSHFNSGNREMNAALGPGYAVLAKPGYRSFAITFENYVGFFIRNESFAEPEENEDYSKKLRTYKKSNFLDFIETSTFAGQITDDPIIHFCVVCADHIIDVASTTPPEIRLESISEDVGEQDTGLE